MSQPTGVLSAIATAVLLLGTPQGFAAAAATTQTCAVDPARSGHATAVIAALTRLQASLSAVQHAALELPLAHDTAIRWSNLPVAIVPRAGLRLGDLDASQKAAAQKLLDALLSACGSKLLTEIRLADDTLEKVDTRHIGWSGANYYLTILGTPAKKQPWMLQLGGHHIAYNFTFNGREAGATPLFFGTEPIKFSVAGTAYEPLAAQSSAMSELAQALAAHPQARLSGTFTDVVKGVVMGAPGAGGLPTGGTDTGFPHSYPTGTVDRGILFSALSPAEQQRVRAAIASYASLPGSEIARPLVDAYLSPAALRDTYAGFAGQPDLSAKGSYVRIDGPRIWMELVVQPAVAEPKELHYHALWRDKQSDYGGEVAR